MSFLTLAVCHRQLFGFNGSKTCICGGKTFCWCIAVLRGSVVWCVIAVRIVSCCLFVEDLLFELVALLWLNCRCHCGGLCGGVRFVTTLYLSIAFSLLIPSGI